MAGSPPAHSFPMRTNCLVATVVAVLSLVAPAPGQTDRQGISSPQVTMPVRSDRHAPPNGLPNVPAATNRLAPQTLTMRVIRKPAKGQETATEQTVSRTVERVHMVGQQGEWLFERNTVDPRRVFGFLIDHRSQVIVRYEESDLRMTRGVRGWADVLLLGFDPSVLKNYRRTEAKRTIGVVRFVRYAATQKDSPNQMWWSEEASLAHDFAVVDNAASTRTSITGIRDGVDETLFQEPTARFPGYKSYNFADWLDRH